MQRCSAPTTWWRSPTSDHRAAHVDQRRPEPGAAGARRDRLELNRPYITLSPALRTIGQVESKGTLDYNALLVKFQRRFANNFSFLNSYTYGKAIDLNSDNDGLVTLTNVYDLDYNRGPADYDITHTLSSSWIYELPWAREKLYGGWQFSGILSAARRPAADGHADPGRPVHGHWKSSEPSVRWQARPPDHR